MIDWRSIANSRRLVGGLLVKLGGEVYRCCNLSKSEYCPVVIGGFDDRGAFLVLTSCRGVEVNSAVSETVGWLKVMWDNFQPTLVGAMSCLA